VRVLTTNISEYDLFGNRAVANIVCEDWVILV